MACSSSNTIFLICVRSRRGGGQVCTLQRTKFPISIMSFNLMYHYNGELNVLCVSKMSPVLAKGAKYMRSNS